MVRPKRVISMRRKGSRLSLRFGVMWAGTIAAIILVGYTTWPFVGHAFGSGSSSGFKCEAPSVVAPEINQEIAPCHWNPDGGEVGEGSCDPGESGGGGDRLRSLIRILRNRQTAAVFVGIK